MVFVLAKEMDVIGFQATALAYPRALNSPQSLIAKRPVLKGSDEHSLLACALDEIACGVIILDALARLQHANLAGQAVLQKSQVLCTQDTRIRATHSPDSSKLHDAIAKALKGKRSMLTLGSRSQTTVAVVPLNRHIQPQNHPPLGENTPAHALSLTNPSPRVALIFSRSGMCEALMMSFFARAYKLTRSEEQILSLLCVGHTAPEMAKQLSVGEATVRTHIRSICQKTHSSGIRDITKRLALLPPLMSAVMPSAFA
jgi:DNA-binding NarL/FixJ family response regulator